MVAALTQGCSTEYSKREARPLFPESCSGKFLLFLLNDSFALVNGGGISIP
jgi:hypothetical protein